MSSPSYFDIADFMPHGMCYLWRPDILWTSVISDVVTGLAYFSITAAVVIFVRKRKDLPYPWFFLLSGSVIFLACGMSHIISAIVIWEPIYGVSAIAKAITAVTSLATGIVIWLVLPFFLKLPSPAMLEKKNQALQDSLNKLNMAQVSLVESEKMASLGGLVAGVAHEINTPIGVAITAVSHLIDSTNELADNFINNKITRSNFAHYTEDAKNSAAMISTNLNRSANLVKSFKLVAVDQASENLRQYDVEIYCQDILNSLQPALKSMHCQVELSCDDNITLWGDPAVLTQILTNLVMNSLTHAFKNTKDCQIGIKVSVTGHHLKLDYTDNGSGISLENSEKVFEPFFTTKRGKGSSGLGLHIVFNLVTQSLKGTIECLCIPDGGAAFTLLFPLDIRGETEGIKSIPPFN